MQEGIGMKYIYFAFYVTHINAWGFYFKIMLDVDMKRSNCEIIEVIIWYYSPSENLKNKKLVISINEVLENKWSQSEMPELEL